MVMVLVLLFVSDVFQSAKYKAATREQRTRQNTEHRDRRSGSEARAVPPFVVVPLFATFGFFYIVYLTHAREKKYYGRSGQVSHQGLSDLSMDLRGRALSFEFFDAL